MAVISIEENELNSFDIEEVQLVEILGNHFASALERIYRQRQRIEVREAHIMELVGGIDRICYRIQDDLKGPIHNLRNSSFIIRHNPELASEVVDNIDNSLELIVNTLEEMKEITKPTEPDKTLTDIYQILKTAIDLSNVPDNINLATGSARAQDTTRLLQHHKKRHRGYAMRRHIDYIPFDERWRRCVQLHRYREWGTS